MGHVGRCECVWDSEGSAAFGSVFLQHVHVQCLYFCTLLHIRLKVPLVRRASQELATRSINKKWLCNPLDFASTGGVEAAATGGHRRAAGLRFRTPVQQPWRAMRRKRCLRWTDGQRRKETLKCRRTWASQPIWEASICYEKLDVATGDEVFHIQVVFSHSGYFSCCWLPINYATPKVQLSWTCKVNLGI